MPAAAHPLGDQRALVLGHRPADLQQQLVVRVITHRPVQELHLAAVGGQLLDQQHLMDVVAGQPVRRGDHHHVQLGQRRMIAEPIQPRPPQAGAAKAVIAVDMLVLQLPAAPGNRRAQPVKAAARWSAPGPGGWLRPAPTPPPASGTSSAISVRQGTPSRHTERTSSW
jgi:hypothetical protein